MCIRNKRWPSTRVRIVHNPLRFRLNRVPPCPFSSISLSSPPASRWRWSSCWSLPSRFPCRRRSAGLRTPHPVQNPLFLSQQCRAGSSRQRSGGHMTRRHKRRQDGDQARWREVQLCDQEGNAAQEVLGHRRRRRVRLPTAQLQGPQGVGGGVRLAALPLALEVVLAVAAQEGGDERDVEVRLLLRRPHGRLHDTRSVRTERERGDEHDVGDGEDPPEPRR